MQESALVLWLSINKINNLLLLVLTPWNIDVFHGGSELFWNFGAAFSQNEDLGCMNVSTC